MIRINSRTHALVESINANARLLCTTIRYIIAREPESRTYSIINNALFSNELHYKFQQRSGRKKTLPA